MSKSHLPSRWVGAGSPTPQFNGKAVLRRRPKLGTSRTWRPHRKHRGGLSALVFSAPLLIVFGYFAWLPMFRATVMSFQQTNLVASPTWVGLDNFAFVLSDPLLWTACLNTLYFTLLALVFGFPIPLFLAVAMSEFRRARGVLSLLVYLPVVVPPAVAVLLWRIFYSAGPNGVFNSILGGVGLGPYSWIQSTDGAMPSLVLLATWSSAGGSVIIYLAALTGVRSELYDAADIDGASTWRKVWHITMPQLRGVMLVMLILQVISTFQVFTEPFLLTGGGPQNSTTTVLLLIYRYAFGVGGGGNYGAATALSVMLALFLAVMSAVYFRATRSWSTE